MRCAWCNVYRQGTEGVVILTKDGMVWLCNKHWTKAAEMREEKQREQGQDR